METETLTAQKLCNRFALAKLAERTVTSILQKSGVPHVKGKGYNVILATEALLAFYVAGYARRDVAGESDRARRNRALADLAEMEVAEREGVLCHRQQMIDDVKDAVARGSAAIGRLRNLTTEQKESVLKILRETKLPPLENEDHDES